MYYYYYALSTLALMLPASSHHSFSICRIHCVFREQFNKFPIQYSQRRSVAIIRIVMVVGVVVTLIIVIIIIFSCCCCCHRVECNCCTILPCTHCCYCCCTGDDDDDDNNLLDGRSNYWDLSGGYDADDGMNDRDATDNVSITPHVELLCLPSW